MNDLLRLRDNGPQWPYSRAQLAADEPQLSLTYELPEHELRSLEQLDIYVYRAVPSEPPAADPRTERVEEATPALEGDQWVQQWTVRAATEEEIAAYDAANAPVPDYVAFYNAFLVSSLYNATLVPTLLQPGSDVLGNTMTIVAIALQDAMAGRVPLPNGEQPNSLQSAIWLLMSVLAPSLSEADGAELQGLLEAHNLAPYYTLLPPQP